MATLYSHADRNVRKTWFLMTVFLAIVVGVGYFVSYEYSNPGILYGAIIFSVFMNVLSYWYSDKIALAMSGAHPALKEEYLELHRITENISITAGLPMPRLYVIDDPSPNAFATGRNKEHAAVAVTTGLLNILEKNELEGVIAHELAHVANRDTLLQTVVVVLVGFISIIADIFLRSSLLGGRKKEGSAGGILAIVGIVFIILSPIVAQIIQLAISRKREFLADATGALYTRYPEGLANALRKISSSDVPLRKAHNATAHLFISNPFGASGMTKGLAKLFMTHPPVEERVAALLDQKI